MYDEFADDDEFRYIIAVRLTSPHMPLLHIRLSSMRSIYLSRLASRSLSNKTRISFSLTGPYCQPASGTAHLNIPNNRPGSILDELDADLRYPAAGPSSSKHLRNLSELNWLCVHPVELTCTS
jgi:hypothetical protein